jgi:hypothetical protein
VARKKDVIPEDVREFFRKQGKIGGKKGGALSWANMTPEEKTARAKKAVAARKWHAVKPVEEKKPAADKKKATRKRAKT